MATSTRVAANLRALDLLGKTSRGLATWQSLRSPFLQQSFRAVATEAHSAAAMTGNAGHGNSKATSPQPGAKNVRVERDSLGDVEVPAERLWGAQTQRSLQNFRISDGERMPRNLIRAMGIVKLAAVRVNMRFKKVDQAVGEAIERAASEVAEGNHLEEFPLVVWQTGSGTQTNMNTNEVISNRAIDLMGGTRGTKSPVHPNDHVNMGQSSNDTFPTAMHISAALDTHGYLLPQLRAMASALHELVDKFDGIVKIGRTHLQDATPLTLGQEFSGFLSMVRNAIRRIETALPGVLELAQGGTAVGTGLNTYTGFSEQFGEEVANITQLPFKTAENKFESLGGVGAMVELSAALATSATELLKIANDIRLLSSGPRSGFCELVLPANEPGSSIMPGKVNPTQCEALSMVCAEVIGNHSAVMVGSTHGHLQLNVFRPLIVYNVLRSVRLLGDATRSFTDNCLVGIEANRKAITHHLNNSLMLITALSPHIGYDNCAAIAKHAHAHNLSLKEAAQALHLVDEATFDQMVKPENMIGPSEV